MGVRESLVSRWSLHVFAKRDLLLGADLPLNVFLSIDNQVKLLEGFLFQDCEVNRRQFFLLFLEVAQLFLLMIVSVHFTHSLVDQLLTGIRFDSRHFPNVFLKGVPVCAYFVIFLRVAFFDNLSLLPLMLGSFLYVREFFCVRRLKLFQIQIISLLKNAFPLDLGNV